MRHIAIIGQTQRDCAQWAHENEDRITSFNRASLTGVAWFLGVQRPFRIVTADFPDRLRGVELAGFVLTSYVPQNIVQLAQMQVRD